MVGLGPVVECTELYFCVEMKTTLIFRTFFFNQYLNKFLQKKKTEMVKSSLNRKYICRLVSIGSWYCVIVQSTLEVAVPRIFQVYPVIPSRYAALC